MASVGGKPSLQVIFAVHARALGAALTGTKPQMYRDIMRLIKHMAGTSVRASLRATTCTAHLTFLSLSCAEPESQPAEADCDDAVSG
jgi:hypothetical protein